MEKEHRWVQTWKVSTGRDRGKHFYYASPEGVAIPNSAKKLDKGLDVRGHGGYVVTPGSRHYSGNYYAWWNDWHPSKRRVAKLPPWLQEKILGAGNSKGKHRAPAPVSEWRDLVASTVNGPVGDHSGSRNDTVARLTGYLLNGFNDPGVVYELVKSWNATHCRPPLDGEELKSIFLSIADRDSQKRALA
jgi:hypothetical protein